MPRASAVSSASTAAQPMRLSADSGVPLYVQLADLFRYKVMSGEWPRGHRLPNFDAIAGEYQVARITVRKAIARLVQEGMLDAQPSRGTVVLGGVARLEGTAAARPQHANADDQLRIKILSRKVVNELPEDFRRPYAAFERYVEIRKVHVVRAIPYALTRVFVAEPVFARFPKGEETRAKLLRLVLAYGGDDAFQLRQHTMVEPSDGVVSAQLAYPTGSPVARILRQVFGADQRLAYAGMSWYRGDSFEMDMTLPRQMIADSPLGLTTPVMRRS